MKYIYIFNEGSIASVYGIGTYIRQLTECLKHQPDISLNVVHLYSDEKDLKIIELGGVCTYYFPNIQFPFKSKFNRARYYRNCCYLLKERMRINQADKLFFHLNYNHQYPLLDLFKKQFPTTFVLYTVHNQDWCFKLNGNQYHFLSLINKERDLISNQKEKNAIEGYDCEIKLYKATDQIICLAEYTKKLLIDVYGITENKISLIYNGLKDEEKSISPESRRQIKRSLLIPENSKVILFVGRLQEIKGVEFLIRAFKTVLFHEPDAHLFIVGGGLFATYFSEAKGYWSKITFTGLLEKEELFDLYSIADIGVMPSFHEQCSYVAIEMMMHGIPLIASTSTGLREMVEDEVTGLHIPVIEYPEKVDIDMNIFTEKMIYLLKNHEERKRMSKNARERYLKYYSSKIMEEKMASFYQNLFT
jgi:glycosyltransferase